MTFWQYLQATCTETEHLDERTAEKLAELLKRGHSVADLIGHYSDDFGHLPLPSIKQLAKVCKQWAYWSRRVEHALQGQAKPGATTCLKEALETTKTVDEIELMLRAARLSPDVEFSDVADRLASLGAALDLWRRCFSLAQKEGELVCQAVRPDDTRLEHYDQYLKTRESMSGIKPHRWLAMRRGQKEGVLALSFALPTETMLEQLRLLRSRLGLHLKERSDTSLFDELIGDDLSPWLFRYLDQTAHEEAIETACGSLKGLLMNVLARAPQVGALYLGRLNAPCAAVIVDHEGEVVNQIIGKCAQYETWFNEVERFFQHAEVQQIVVPSNTFSHEAITAMEKRFSTGYHLVWVRAAALAEARLPLTDPPFRLNPTVASALVLARRAIDPLKAWSIVDPVSIGIAEYQNDLDQDKLRAALAEVFDLCRWERRQEANPRYKKSATVPAPTTVSPHAVAKLNPLVQSLHDLRPGMRIQGVVSNISHFGAFVNLGLGCEGLIHISELSDTFVNNPQEVVSLGQQVSARILSVDIPRNRIALSLKTDHQSGGAREPRMASPSVTSHTPTTGRSPKNRRDALASLEKLFKK